MIARDQLKSIVERVERLEEETKALNADKSDVYKEAKGNGYEPKIIKRIVARRRKDAAEAAEEDALFEIYMDALNGGNGTVIATRARTESGAAISPVTPQFEGSTDRKVSVESGSRAAFDDGPEMPAYLRHVS